MRCMKLVFAGILALQLAACGHERTGRKAYERGDYATALEAFRQDDTPAAHFALGVLYYKGEGVARQLETARRHFQLAARQGHAGAQFNLGLMFGNGEGGEKSLAEAARWYRLAAEQDYVRAQYNLGMMHVYGDGVAKDRREALRWLVKAARQGHRKAQLKLAEMLQSREEKKDHVLENR